MASLVFSLQSEEDARVADHELRRNGVAEQLIRIIDSRVLARAANDPAIAGEFNREIATGRILLEVRIDEQNEPAVERVIRMLGGDARKFVIGERGAGDALDD